ncbi:MAG: ectoine synthase [Rhodobacteraceae bacterium]|nr:ectoine synthase [Paracoccaceae bacterium]
MIVRTVEDLKILGSFRENPGIWSSARYLLSRDNMGFTLTETRISAGSSQTMQYKNHVEANLVIEGRGLLTEIETGAAHKLEPGTMYALDRHDRHRIDARTDMRVVCVFLPALVGPETHDEDGSYPALEQ